MIPGLCSALYRGSSGTSGGMTVIASPDAVYGADGQTTVGPAAVSVLGGTPPYTYAWQYLTGDPSVTLTHPTLASTSFSYSGLSPGDSVYAQFFCLVTDSAARSATTNIVQANFSEST